MLGGLTDQVTKLVRELLDELREIRTELQLLRNAIENQQNHPAIRPPAPKRTQRKQQT